MRFTRTLFAEKCREEEEFEPRLSKWPENHVWVIKSRKHYRMEKKGGKQQQNINAGESSGSQPTLFSTFFMIYLSMKYPYYYNS